MLTGYGMHASGFCAVRSAAICTNTTIFGFIIRCEWFAPFSPATTLCTHHPVHVYTFYIYALSWFIDGAIRRYHTL